MNISLTLYAELLMEHEWTYPRSDDGRAYRKGRDERQYLRGVAMVGGADYTALFNRAAAKFGAGSMA
jgi:hypothetical protein